MIIIDLKFQGLSRAIAAFLIPTDDGPVLVETGPHSTLPELERGINEAGYQISDIKHVLLSHIHLDHAGAAWYLATKGATIYVHRYGYRHLQDPQRLMSSATRIYGEEMERLWGRMEAIPHHLLVSVEEDSPILIGGKSFQPWYTPGHAKHHLAWQLDDMLFTGDVAGVKIEKGPVMPPCPPPDIDIELWVSSINKIRSLDVSALYLTHFGLIDNVESHLDELQQRLIAWSEWIKPYWHAQKSASEIIAPFQEFVKTELLNAGLSESEVRTYEAANPSWMSVSGLLRYWDKIEHSQS